MLYHEKRNSLFRFPFLKKWYFLDLVCSVHEVTITIKLSYGNRCLLNKWQFYRPNMWTSCCNHEKRSLLVKCPLLKKWHFPDLVCSIHVVTITNGLSYSSRTVLKKWHFPYLICALNVATMKIVAFS